MPDVFNGGGDMGARMRAFDWAGTPLGTPDTWPQSLRSAVGICLNSRFPIAIYWGPQLALLYNDAWSPILGEKHPTALGQPGRVVWPEIWPEIGPLFAAVQRTGEGVWQQDQLLPMHRHGYTEECYFNFTFSPIRSDDGQVAGIFNAVIETTFRIIEERRAQSLRELSERTAGAQSAAEACARAAEVLAASPADVPFSLFYLCEHDASPLQFAAAAGAALPDSMRPATIDSDDPTAPWPLAALHATQGAVVDQLSERFGVTLPSGMWPEAVEQALVVPIPSMQAMQPVGLFIAGVSPRRALDAAYHTFIGRIAMQVATAIGHARTYAAERQRAEALAAIDQAKTTFFANVSHELRTPLTLLLGPLEEALAQPDGVSADTRARLDVAHRNALRLLKLVNTLLEFSRIEAGRVHAAYAPTDLAALTTDLASVFRSTIERAGLRLIVDCPPLAAPVYVDHEMWETIIFNLLSNAFKFTFAGEVVVTLRQVGSTVELAVRDTGVGIAAAEIPHLFTRFHRVKGAQGRTFEGSGIGLALVYELVQLHSGAVRVASDVGQGTTFTVTLPTGTAHLPADRVGAGGGRVMAGLRAEAYVEEARRWLPEDSAEIQAVGPEAMIAPEPGAAADLPPAQILLVDDNADMRTYIWRLLSPKWAVVAVADGVTALRVAQAQPFELVLSDVMLPHLDGFGLLAALRADTRLKTLPVILLSARAGEEARAEGMEAGADDYLVKPFSARELLARVEAHITMARLRREVAEREQALRTEAQAAREQLERVFARVSESEARFRYIADAAPGLIWISDATKQYTWFNKPWLDFTGRTLEQEYGDGWTNGVYADDAERCMATYVAAFDAREPFSIEYRLQRYDGEYRWLLDNGVPRFASNGEFIGYIGSCIDIHDRKQAEEEIRLVNERFRIAEGASDGFIYDWDVASDTVKRSERFTKVLGYEQDDLPQTSAAWRALIHPEDLARIQSLLTVLPTESLSGSRNEYRVRHKNGVWMWMLDENVAMYREGKVWRVIGSTLNITERKHRELNAQFLGDITADLALLTSSDEMMRTASTKIASYLAISSCLLCEIEQDTGKVTIFHEHREPSLPRLDAEQSAADWVSEDLWDRLIAGQDVVINDAAADPRTAPGRESLKQIGIGSCIVAPCLSGGRLKFVLIVGHPQAHQWRTDEQDLIHEIALRIWLSYDRARTQAQLRANAARQALLLSLLQDQRETSDPDVMLVTAAETIGRYLGANRVGFFDMLDDDTLSFTRSWTDGVLTPLSGIFPAIGIGTRYLVAVRAGRTLGIADTVHDPLTADSQFGTIGARAIIGVPIIRGGRWHAGFYINHATVRRWTDAEIALAHDIGEQTWDAVERARAEAALREAQARRLAEEQQHAARLQQLNAASLAINAAATRNDVLNLIAEQARALIGAKQAVVDVVPDSNGSQMQAVGSLDERLARSEHETRPQRNAIMAAPLTDSDGARIGTLQLVDKVAGGFTAADEALLQQLAQMASVALENQTLYAQEQELRAQAEEASRLKDEFLATVSHELRTPLTAVLGYAQLLRARKRDEAYVARTAEKLVRSAKDQALIIDDLLDVSRIVSGKLRIEPQPIDLISVIEAALDTVRPAVEARQLQLHVALNPEASTIIGDANRLQQVVWNLLSNATKFTPPGGIIQILLEPDGRDAWLTIRDTGQGIRPAFLPFVFDRFRQADSASNRAHGGLGLGLAIVRNLVELHGGSVQAASDGEGHGSTFTVRLPLDRIGDAPVSVQPMADDPPPDCPPVLRGLRVLVVDDQPDIVELLHDILATCGAVVMTCSGAQEALAALRAWKPAVLVSDIAMPGADGYWLIERVRALALEDGGGTPAVALTAYVRAEERERVLAAGFQLYVPKPVDPAELRYVIAHLARIEALD